MVINGGAGGGAGGTVDLYEFLSNETLSLPKEYRAVIVSGNVSSRKSVVETQLLFPGYSGDVNTTTVYFDSSGKSLEADGGSSTYLIHVLAFA